MIMVYYPAIVERGNGSYGVYFPDLPGCTSAGRTVQEAALAAEDALSGHLTALIEHGEEIPAPSDPETLGYDPDVEEVARLLIRGQCPEHVV